MPRPFSLDTFLLGEFRLDFDEWLRLVCPKYLFGVVLLCDYYYGMPVNRMFCDLLVFEMLLTLPIAREDLTFPGSILGPVRAPLPYFSNVVRPLC